MSEKFPAIPNPVADLEAHQRTLLALKESVEMLTGQRGRLRAALLRDIPEPMPPPPPIPPDDFRLVADIPITSVTTVDVEWTTGDYSALTVYVLGVYPASSPGSNNLAVRFRQGTSYLSGATDYTRHWAYWWLATGASNEDMATQALLQLNGNTGGDDLFSVAHFHVGGTNMEPGMIAHSRWSTNTPSARAWGFFVSSLHAEGEINGLRFFWSSGDNFAARGRIVVYGVPK